jgi:hypothetical protein
VNAAAKNKKYKVKNVPEPTRPAAESGTCHLVFMREYLSAGDKEVV